MKREFSRRREVMQENIWKIVVTIEIIELQHSDQYQHLAIKIEILRFIGLQKDFFLKKIEIPRFRKTRGWSN